MAIFKRGKWYWMDAVVNGHRYREPLGTTDSRKAPSLERERVSQLKDKAPDPTARSKAVSTMSIHDAIETYITERSAQVSVRMVEYWRNQCKPLSNSKAFGEVRLSKITSAMIGAYQSERLEQGRAPKTINGEVSVLRQLLKHARIWYRFQEDYKPIPNTKPPTGRALTPEESAKLFEIAKTRPDWTYAYVAATLSFYCGMRACEIRGLHWKDIDWNNRLISITRSKTPAGWRTPSLNATCHDALRKLFEEASLLGAAEPEHYIFPWHGREQRINPTKPMGSLRTAWRSILKAAGLKGVRFHDGRHTAITTLAEKGLMKTYSHIRRKALNEAAAALEPNPTSESENES